MWYLGITSEKDEELDEGLGESVIGHLMELLKLSDRYMGVIILLFLHLHIFENVHNIKQSYRVQLIFFLWQWFLNVAQQLNLY